MQCQLAPCRPPRAAGRLLVLVTAAASRRASSSGGGSSSPADRPAAAAAAAAATPAAPAPLASVRSGQLAAKLTETAKSIQWVDAEKDRPQEAGKQQIEALEARLGHRFTNRYLLRLALIHSSAAPTTNNSILAWIGDAALYSVLSEEVGGCLGYVAIGSLSEVRKRLIGRAMCEQYAARLGLGEHLVMGKSYTLPHGKASSNMVAELFEAVMGAIYLDADIEAVRRVFLSHFPLPADPQVLLQQPEAVLGGSGGGGGGGGADSPWD